MTQRSNHLRNAHAPRNAARAAASLRQQLIGKPVLVATLAITALITVLVLITGPISAEYGFV